MNAIDHAVSALFDALLWPLERLGAGFALVFASAVFGVIALVVFKHVSPQKRIKAAKDAIKAHLLEIRIYRDDLRVVARATFLAIARNFQYLGLNLLPFVPLSLPFALVIAQLVVRYGFAPVPVTSGPHELAGSGTTIEVRLAPESAALASDLVVRYSDGVEAVSPLVRLPREGRAFQEVVVRTSGEHTITLELPNGVRETKSLVAGDPARRMQPSRGSGFLDALLWPAEDTFAASSPFREVSFVYPDSRWRWLPGGPGGVVLTFLVASMIAGALAIKPLKVQI